MARLGMARIGLASVEPVWEHCVATACRPWRRWADLAMDQCCPAGEACAEFAHRALAELGAGEERLRALRSGLTGRIRISDTVSWGPQVLAGKLPEFLRLHPVIELELQRVDRLVDEACERIDTARRGSTTPPRGLVCEPLAVVGWSVVGGR